ncbi:type VII secretion-associated protein [Gordonia sp. HS-NH1]|uniref:type VII secretion-associated protein n=1 Tax=Gordonia sp. HS-NH1 TaxID=1435068 RepID=UPI0006E1A938|nr:type VII secretion-associated protein [Gordonia sp. HS-NH1]
MTGAGGAQGSDAGPAHLTEQGNPRPTVVDLAFGTPLVWEPDLGLRRVDRDVRTLLESVDQTSVVVDGRRDHLRQVWRRVFADLGLPAGRPMVVGHPSTWGPRRASTLADVGDARSSVELVPRAVLVARSHADLTVQRCAVVETTHLPRPPADPAHPRPSWWDVQIVGRGPDGWAVERSGVIRPGPGDRSHSSVVVDGIDVIDDSVEAVFVDGDRRDEVSAAIDLVSAHAVAGRVVAVDRDLGVRLGHRTGGAADDAVAPVRDPGPPGAVPAGGTRRRPRSLVAAAVVAALVVSGAVGVGLWQRDPASGTSSTDVRLGRATLTVPGDWRQAEQETPTDAADDPSTTRAVFVDPDDGRRIIAVLTEVREGSTPASVADSLRNRIEQRGDDVVTEFSATTRFAGRDVIGYRESPASGGAIRWYVVVDDGLQVSIGCQAGTAAEPTDAECAEAVRSVRVSPS